MGVCLLYSVKTSCNIPEFVILTEVQAWSASLLQSNGVHAEVGKFSTAVLVVALPLEILRIFTSFIWFIYFRRKSASQCRISGTCP